MHREHTTNQNSKIAEFSLWCPHSISRSLQSPLVFRLKKGEMRGENERRQEVAWLYTQDFELHATCRQSVVSKRSCFTVLPASFLSLFFSLSHMSVVTRSVFHFKRSSRKIKVRVKLFKETVIYTLSLGVLRKS